MKWLLGIALALILGGLWWTGALEELGDMDRLRELVTDAGMAGPLVFVGLVTLLFPVLLAGPPIWISGTIWTIPLAIFYSAVASTCASLIFYGLARWLGRDWAAERIPEKLRAYEEKLERHPYRTVALLRALLWINPAVDILIGVSAVPFHVYLASSAIVLAPLTVVHVMLPAKGIELADVAPDWLAPAIGAVAFVGLMIWGVRAWRARVAS